MQTVVFMGCRCVSAVQTVYDGTDRLETSIDNLFQRDCPSQYLGQWIFPDVNELRLLPGYRPDLVKGQVLCVFVCECMRDSVM